MSRINKHSFITAGENIVDGDDLRTIVILSKERLRERWKGEYGRKILSDWKANHFDRDYIASCVGRYYDHIDLRGIPLEGCKIKGQDFSFIDFFAASFVDAEFDKVDLTDSWLSETNIKGAKFRWSTMDNVLLDNVEFDNTTEFSGVNLNKINFNLAVLLQDLAVTQQRIDHLKSRNPVVAWILWATSDYGRSLTRWLVWIFCVIFGFALFYWLCPSAINKSGFLNSLYFSFVTFTTLGYGDVLPTSPISQIAVVLEVIFGYAMGGLLVAILAKKVLGN
jgi:hypothetical protein